MTNIHLVWVLYSDEVFMHYLSFFSTGQCMRHEQTDRKMYGSNGRKEEQKVAFIIEVIIMSWPKQ